MTGLGRTARRALARTPLLPPAACAVAGGAVGFQTPFAWAFFAAGAALAGALAASRRRRAAALAASLALLAGAIAAGGSSIHQTRLALQREAMPAGLVEVIGTVASPPDPGRNSAGLLLRCRFIRPAEAGAAWQPWRGALRLTAYGVGRRLHYGNTVLVSGKTRAPGDSSYRAYLDRLGASAHLSVGCSGIRVLRRGDGALSGLFRIREELSRRCDELVPGEDGAVLRALLLGETRGVSRGTWEAFRRSGTVHLLSISGLHLGILAAIIILAATAAGVPRRGRWLVAILVITLYAVFTGARTPVVRATVMVWALGLATLWRRQYWPLNSLALAALAIALVRPTEATSPGFQLSFLATLGIIALVPPAGSALRRLPRIARALLATLAVSAAAQLAVAPALAAHFGQLPLLAVLVNLLAVPLLGIVLLLATVTLLLTLAAPPAALILAPPLAWSLACLRWLCTRAADLPLATVNVAPPSGPTLLAWSAGLAIVLAWGVIAQVGEESPGR